MAETPNLDEVVAALPEEHRQAVSGLFNGLTAKHQTDFNNLRSTLDKQVSDAKKQAADLEFELAGLRDRGGSGGGLRTELTESQKALQARREQEQAKAAEAERLAQIQSERDSLASRLFDYAKREALTNGVHKDIIAMAKNADHLNELITMSRVFSPNGNGNGAATNGGGSTGTIPSGGGQIAPDDQLGAADRIFQTAERRTGSR